MIKIKMPRKSELKIRPREEVVKEKQLDKEIAYYKYLQKLLDKLGEQMEYSASEGSNYAMLKIDEEMCKYYKKDLMEGYEFCRTVIKNYGYKSVTLNHMGNIFLKVYLDDTTDEEIQNEIKVCREEYIKFCIQIFGTIGIGLIILVLLLFKIGG